MCSSVYTDVLSPWTQEATNYYHDRIYNRAEAWFNGNWVRIINRHGRVERVAARTLTRRARWLTTPVFIVSAALFVVSFVKRWLGLTNYVINALLIPWMDHRSSLALTEDYYYNSKNKKKSSFISHRWHRLLNSIRHCWNYSYPICTYFNLAKSELRVALLAGNACNFISGYVCI